MMQAGRLRVVAALALGAVLAASAAGAFDQIEPGMSAAKNDIALTSGVLAKDRFYRDIDLANDTEAIAVARRYLEENPQDESFARDAAAALVRDHYESDARALLALYEHEVALETTPVPLATPSPAPAATPSLSPVPVVTPLPAGNTDPKAHLERAYALLSAHRDAEARTELEAYLTAVPDDAQAWRQLSYVDESLKDDPGEVAALDRFISLEPASDDAALQRAYAYVRLGKNDLATREFRRLARSQDPKVSAAAKAETAQRVAAVPKKGEGFGYLDYDTRFRDSFGGIDLRYAPKPRDLSPYASVHLVGDARSGSGRFAQIFSDNAAVLDVGLRKHLGSAVFAFVEAGVGVGLRGQNTITDLRYGLAGGYQHGTVHNGVSADASTAFYSRYAGNIITFADVRKAVPLARNVSLLLGANAGADAQRLFYNNFLEGVGGVQVGSNALRLRVEAVQGTYLWRGIGRPKNAGYSALRPVLLFGWSF